MSTLPPSFEINGVAIPSVGFGTFQGGEDVPKGAVRDAVLKALQCGYRHIDTAWAYGNEDEVGEAIRESGIKREEIFVTTKLGQTWHQPEDVEKALDTSLRALQLDYVDLYLMHFPNAYVHGPGNSTVRHEDNKPIIDRALSRAYPQTWQAMEKLVDKGKAKLIGVSNFNMLKLKRILEVARIRPAVNQMELHPYLPQNELLRFCAGKGIHAMAHQPLGGNPAPIVNPNAGRPGPLQDKDIADIASAAGKTSAQVLLSWALQRGTSVVPKSVQERRMIENKDLSRLTDGQMDRINRLADEKGSVRFLDPREYLGFNIFDEEHDEPVESGD